MASRLIDRNGEGVLGFITNHGYLDNATFVDMRRHLLETFDKIYVFDLHGNATKNEQSPDGHSLARRPARRISRPSPVAPLAGLDHRAMCAP